MKMSRKVHRFIHVQNFLFYVLLVVAIGLLAYLSREYVYRADWTFGQRNSLTEACTVLLKGIDEPIRFVMYVPDDTALREKLRKLIEKYQRVKSEVELEFVNPDLDPVRAKLDGVEYTGQIVIRLGERTEIVESTSEQVIANALQRMSRGSERLAVFLEGHGERDPLAEHSNGISQLLASLEKSGFRAQPHSFVRSQSVPDNARFLVIAAPQKDLLDGEVEIIAPTDVLMIGSREVNPIQVTVAVFDAVGYLGEPMALALRTNQHLTFVVSADGVVTMHEDDAISEPMK